MTIRLSSGLRTAMVTDYGLAIMMNRGHIRIYDGVQPQSADDAPNGTLLGVVCEDGITPTPGSINGGLQFSLEGPGRLGKFGNWVLKGLAAGTPTWWRFVWNAPDDSDYSDYYPRIDGGVGESLFLSSPTIGTFTGEPVNGFLLVLPHQ